MHFCTAPSSAFMLHDDVQAGRYGAWMTDQEAMDYLHRVLRETGLHPSALAKKCGLSSTTLTRPLNNPAHSFRLSRRTLEAIEGGTGIPFSDTAPRRVERGDAPPNGKALVPVYDVAASAGDGTLVDYEAAAYGLAFPPDYLKRLTSSGPHHLSIISVKGESMEPTLLDDDIVLLDTSKTNLSFDGLFVLRFGDALHIKRIGRSAKREHVTIISDNRELYPPIDAAIGEIEAIGKVLWYGRRV